MREQLRALRFLVSTAWKTDRRRTLGLVLEPVGALRFALFAWFLRLLADGAMHRDLRQLALGAAGIAAARVLWFAGLWFGSMIRLRLAEEVGLALDREVAALVAAIPGVEHHERGDYQDRLELLRQSQGVLSDSMNALIRAANFTVAGIGTVVALAWVSPWLLLVVPFALPALPVAASQQRAYGDAEARFAGPARRARHLQALTVDRNAGMELRVFGVEREILARFRQAWRAGREILLAVERRIALQDTAVDVLFVAGFAGAVGFMLWRASRGAATVGQVVMAVYLCQQVRIAILDPIRSGSSVSRALRAASRVLWLRDYARGAAPSPAATQPAPGRLEHGIVFEDVSFRYPGTDRWALRGVSLRIPAGSVIALVGENGAGKTTLVKLLCGMYRPTAGRILVDGVDLAEIDPDAWRARLSAAFQDFVRFELPAQEAVGVGDLPRVDDPAAVAGALDRAGAGDVLPKLPAGAGTQLGARWEGGVDLSTGQWQKLALGRALMRRDPLVVFFDEPTASLDALAEHALFERYAREARAGSARGAVTVLVSHRFSTVRAADLILVIDDGRVTELGGHDELLLREGLYAELYLLQARSYA
ncbi:MAG: ABC transporter ATP-binding protein [Gemmatimonadetes bacterium]|nr:ABC transporter ATP-binding protein [Gemmatimonadota bacterium]